MKNYEFTIYIRKPDFSDDEAADKLYESGCADALFGCSENKYKVNFSRDADSRTKAISSAIDDIRRADIIVESVFVDLDDDEVW